MTMRFCTRFPKLPRNWLNFWRRCKRIRRLMSSSRKYFSKILSRVKTNFWMKQWLTYRIGFQCLNNGLKSLKDSIEILLSICNRRPMNSVLSKKQCFTVLTKINRRCRLTKYHRLWKSSELNRCLMRAQSMRRKSKKISDWIVLSTS